MNWARLIEYALVVVVAMIAAFFIIWWLFPKAGPCTNCVVSMPQVRAECDKQFFTAGTRARQLDAGAEDEFLVAFAENPSDPNATGGGYSSPSGGYSAPTSSSSRPPPRGPGYLMVRAQPQFGYDYSGSQTSSYSNTDTSNTPPETVWDDVVVTVARYVNHLRNDAECGTNVALRFREGRFEHYCEMQHKFGQEDGGQVSYRIFVRNNSSVPIEYCIATNCDASAPYGQGALCQVEQPPAQ